MVFTIYKLAIFHRFHLTTDRENWYLMFKVNWLTTHKTCINCPPTNIKTVWSGQKKKKKNSRRQYLWDFWLTKFKFFPFGFDWQTHKPCMYLWKFRLVQFPISNTLFNPQVCSGNLANSRLELYTLSSDILHWPRKVLMLKYLTSHNNTCIIFIKMLI